MSARQMTEAEFRDFERRIEVIEGMNEIRIQHHFKDIHMNEAALREEIKKRRTALFKKSKGLKKPKNIVDFRNI